MPGFDGTGPRGQGPRTGGGRGFCPPVGNVAPEGTPIVYGVGRGGRPYGGGRGRCFGGGRGAGLPFGGAQALVRNLPVAQTTASDSTLEERVEDLTRQNEELKARLAELDKPAE